MLLQHAPFGPCCNVFDYKVECAAPAMVAARNGTSENGPGQFRNKPGLFGQLRPIPWPKNSRNVAWLRGIGRYRFPYRFPLEREHAGSLEFMARGE